MDWFHLDDSCRVEVDLFGTENEVYWIDIPFQGENYSVNLLHEFRDNLWYADCLKPNNTHHFFTSGEVGKIIDFLDREGYLDESAKRSSDRWRREQERRDLRQVLLL